LPLAILVWVVVWDVPVEHEEYLLCR
jgi:hypothetical protein